MTMKARGTLHAAGCESNSCATPVVGTSSAMTTAVVDVMPPVVKPAIAPAVERPRHQMPRTRRGQKVDAAIAKAMVTVSTS